MSHRSQFADVLELLVIRLGLAGVHVDDDVGRGDARPVGIGVPFAYVQTEPDRLVLDVVGIIHAVPTDTDEIRNIVVSGIPVYKTSDFETVENLLWRKCYR